MSRVSWTDRIDLPTPGSAPAPGSGQALKGVPTREGDRPELLDSGYPNRFGYDEFMRLVDELDTEALIVLNLADAMVGRVPVEEAAMKAAGLVAYLNAEVGAELPEGMPDWPALRAANGHPQPHGVKVFQVGNETWGQKEFSGFPAAAEAAGMSREDFLTRCYVAYGEAIHAVDPSVELICDARSTPKWWDENQDAPVEDIFTYPVLSDPEVQKHYGHVTAHAYQPWNVKELFVGGEAVDASALTSEEAYLACVGIPTSEEVAPREQELAEATGHRFAVTEWNWNGWGQQMPGGQGPGSRVYAASRAGGAATYLHGLLRAGGNASIGTQSMMLAQNWLIGAVRVQEMPGGTRPVVSPTGRATALYAQHHGQERLAAEWEVEPVAIEQDVKLGNARVMSPMPRIDAIVTADGDAYYVHAIHRRWEGEGVLELALPDDAEGTGTRHEVVPVDAGDGVYVAAEREVEVADTSRLMLPPASVSVTVIPRREY